MKSKNELKVSNLSLTAVRRDGDWEGWIKFYLRGVYEISKQATIAAKLIMDLQASHRVLVGNLGKASNTAMRLLDMLYQKPLVSVSTVAEKLLLLHEKQSQI
ncbi:MAG: hypothetical protein A4E55_00876 [Pelotomaculum sp. PtaU1.Bin035]|nr:MAG: hypothetical protein A4E55_00876 [Pelotomaculum sp. PtaU1.Bin035]